MGSFLQDLARAARSLGREPGFAAAAVATLALGIGAVSAVFSLLQGVLLRALPLPHSERLVQLWQTEPDNPRQPVAPANFLGWRRDSRSFEGLASFTVRRRNLLADVPEQVEVASVSSNFLRVLGVGTALGRGFSEGEAPECILSDQLWRRAFGADRSVLGRSLPLDESAYTIVGVLRTGPTFPEAAQVFTRAPRDIPEVGVPIAVDVTQLRDARFLGVIGRLRRGAGLQQAAAEMAALAARLERDFPEENARIGVRMLPLREALVGAARPTLALMGGAGACLLMIAAVNVASLLLARAVRRGREVAIRVALGAGRARLLRQWLAEGLVLGLAGAVPGLLLARAGAPLLRVALPADLPSHAAPSIEPTVLLFTLGVALLTALLFSLAPALHTRRDTALALRGARGETAGPRPRRAHGLLVATEVGLAVVLVAGAGLLLKTLWRLEAAPAGVEADRVVTARVSLPRARALPEPRRRAFFEAVVARLAAIPGVEAAGATQTLPFAGRGISAGLRVEGRRFDASEVVDTCWRTVTPDYFRSLGIPILKGRGFDARDGVGAPPVALVNARLAARLWPGRDPIGERIGTGMDGDDDALATVVGVVGDAPQEGLAAQLRPEMYRPLAQPSRFAAESMTVTLRAAGELEPVLGALRASLGAVDPQAPVTELKRFEQVRRATIGRERGASMALTLFGALALLLAAVGLYGVLAFVVGERTREFGVRLALGASRVAIGRHVLGRSLGFAGPGLVAGLVAALGLGRALEGLLYGVAPYDAATLASAVGVLAGVALAAAYGPARRAAGVEPALALRHE
jgi:putative ABC transport system permease protein